MITERLLIDATGCSPDLAARYAGELSSACLAYSITTPARLAHFLAQIGHESGGLRWVLELWGPTPAQLGYEGRADLGNATPGDGARYRGRGLIQTTGRKNYVRLRDRLWGRGVACPDFEATPEALEQPRWAALSAADYWDMRGLNVLADADQFEEITRRINGGLNGLDDRRARLQKAKLALSVAAPAPQPPAPEPKKKESFMAPIIATLGSILLQAFAPLAKEKIERATGHPEVAAPVYDAMIASARAVSGKDDMLEAVTAAKADPAMLEQVQQAALDKVQALMPLIDKLSEIERRDRADAEASMNAAAERAHVDPTPDQDRYLTTSIVRLMVGILAGVAFMLVLLTYLKVDATILSGLAALFTTLAGGVAGKFNTRYDYRYGSSAGSASSRAALESVITQRKP